MTNNDTDSAANNETNYAGGTVTLLSTGGPTALIEIGGLRLVTDPTFDEPRDYISSSGADLTKTEPPVVGRDALGRIDAVLVSHDQHPDNLDVSGRALLAEVPIVFTTTVGAERLNADRAVHAVGLAPWASHELERPDGGTLTVHAIPAQHGPEGCEPVSGPVIGFVLTGEGLPTVYVSGDNASLALVEQAAERFGPVDTAVIFAGRASVPIVFDGAPLTLDSAQAAEAARILGSRHAVVLHCDSWAHFSEDYSAVEAAFDKAGMADRLPGVRHGRTYRV